MTDRPILFSAPMVRALLAGTKTQTRRVVKPDGKYRLDVVCPADGSPPRCPYGAPGDRLWVRETWQSDPTIDDTWSSTAWNGCKDSRIADLPERFHHPRFVNYRADWLHGDIIWRPSIYMPRWASRILLEVTQVRVERLQDISEADAIAEGIEQMPCSVPDTRKWRNYDPGNGWTPSLALAENSYRSLWDSISGPGSWDANPWCWVVSFRRITP